MTGGGSGLGEAIRSEIAEAGAKAIVVRQDTAKAEDCEEVVRHALRPFGGLHYAVKTTQASAVGRRRRARRTSLTGIAPFDINLNGVRVGMRYPAPAMLESGASECAIVKWRGAVHDGGYYLVDGGYTAV